MSSFARLTILKNNAISTPPPEIREFSHVQCVQVIRKDIFSDVADGHIGDLSAKV